MALVPDLDHRSLIFAVTDIFQPAFGANESVVAPVVGRVVTLLVGGVDTVVEQHVHHVHIFDIDGVKELFVGEGRPMFQLGAGVTALLVLPDAVGDLAEEGQTA